MKLVVKNWDNFDNFVSFDVRKGLNYYFFCFMVWLLQCVISDYEMF